MRSQQGVSDVDVSPSQYQRYNRARTDAVRLLIQSHRAEFEALLQARLIARGWSRKQVKTNSGAWTGAPEPEDVK